MSLLSKSVRLLLLIAFAIAITGLVGQKAAMAAKGGGGKVSVTAADPSEADQGAELDVWISGEGFDAGSTAEFLVGGTTDASQVEVLSNEYEPDTGKLKSRIRVKGTAVASEYDIQVTNSRGRRGKGTTLFRVNLKEETACTGLEPKEPEIAYLTGLATDGDFETQDLYLSSASGCDRYLLLQDAAVKVPGDVYNGQQEPGAYLVGVRGLRLDVAGDRGVVVWRDREVELDRLYALGFDVTASGVTPDALGPQVIYVAPVGATVTQSDVRINDQGDLELLVVEIERVNGEVVERRLVAVNQTTQDTALLMSGGCPARDDLSTCYRLDQGFRPWWSEDGSEALVNLYSLDGETAMGRLDQVNGIWGPAEVLMTHESQLTVIGVRSDGLLAYEWLNYVSRRNGRTNFKETQWLAGAIDPELCVASDCVPADGTLLGADADKFPRNFLRGGGLLFNETGPGAQDNIRVYSDPFTGAVGSLEINDVGGERDTTY